MLRLAVGDDVAEGGIEKEAEVEIVGREVAEPEMVSDLVGELVRVLLVVAAADLEGEVVDGVLQSDARKLGSTTTMRSPLAAKLLGAVLLTLAYNKQLAAVETRSSLKAKA